MDYYRKQSHLNENQEEWKKIKRYMYLIINFEYLLFGIELTIFEATEYYYFRNILHCANAVEYYSITLALSVLGTFTSRLLFSRLLTKSSSYKLLAITSNLLSIIGYIIYLVPISPNYVMAGRTISSLGKSSNIISLTLLKALYTDQEELDTKVSISSNLLTVGTIVGPILAFLFLMIDGNIAGLHLTYGNAPAFYLIICKTILFFANILLMHDIPKLDETNNPLTDSEFHFDELHFFRNNDEKEVSKHVDTTYRTVFKLDVVLIGIVLLTFGIVFKVINSSLAVEAFPLLSWEIHSIVALTLCNALFGTVISVILAWCFEYTNHFLNLIGGMVLGVFSVILYATAPAYTTHYIPGSILFCLMSSLNVLSACITGLSCRMIIVHVVSDKYHDYADMIRIYTIEVSHFIGALFIPIMHSYMTLCGYIMIAITFSQIVITGVKFKHLWI